MAEPSSKQPTMEQVIAAQNTQILTLKENIKTQSEELEQLRAEHAVEISRHQENEARLQHELELAKGEFEIQMNEKIAQAEKELCLEYEANFLTKLALQKAVHSETENRLRDEYQTKIENMTSELAHQAFVYSETESKLRAEYQVLVDDLTSQLATQKAAHSETESELIAEYQAKITELESELESIEELLKLENSGDHSALEQAHTEITSQLEEQHRREITDMRSSFSQTLEELNNKHAGEVSELQAGFKSQLEELMTQHATGIEEVKKEHAQDKTAIIQQLESKHNEEMAALKASFEEKFTEIQSQCSSEIERVQKEAQLQQGELLKTSDQAKQEREALLQEHKSEISQLEAIHSQVISELKEEIAKSKRHSRPHSARDSPARSLDESLGVIQSETALLSPSKMQQFRAHFIEQREKAAAQNRDRQTLSPKKNTPIAGPNSPSKIRDSYETKLAKLEAKLVAERNSQIIALVQKHELELTNVKIRARSEIEEEHFRQVEKVVADCSAEKNSALEALSREKDAEMENRISELKASHATVIEKMKAEQDSTIEALKNEHSANVQALQQQFQSELNTLRSLEPTGGDFESKLAEQKEQLKVEFSLKFKEVTEKLRAVHQTELKTQKEEIESTHKHAMEVVKNELVAEHEREMDTVMEQHRAEVVALRESYEVRLGQLETDYAQRLKSIAVQQESEDTENKQLENTVRQELSRLSEDLEQKLQQLESERQQLKERETTAQREHEQLRTELERVRAELTAAHTKGRDSQEQLVAARSAMEELRQETTLLRQAGESREQEVLQARSTVSNNANDLRTLQAQRDVLQSTVNALYGAVSSSLELSTLVNSVLGNQQVPGALGESYNSGGGCQSSLDHSSSALSERLLAGGGSPDLTTSQYSTPTHHAHTSPVTPHAPTLSTATGSATSVNTWNEMKQTPSVDSGILSQHTSTMHTDSSTLVGTPSTVTVATPTMGTPPNASEANLTIAPLETTTDHQPPLLDHSVQELADETAPSFLSVSLMSATDSIVNHSQTLPGQSLLIGGISQDTTLQSLPEQASIQDLSVLPLDASTASQDALQASLSSAQPTAVTTVGQTLSTQQPSHEFIASHSVSSEHVQLVLPDLRVINSQLRLFHELVGTLVERYAQLLTEFDQRVTVKERELQAQLDSQTEAYLQQESQLQSTEHATTAQLALLQQSHNEHQSRLEQYANSERKLQAELIAMKGTNTELEARLCAEREAMDLKVSELTASNRELERRLEEQETGLRERSDEVESLEEQLAQRQAELENSETKIKMLSKQSEALKEVNQQLRAKQEQADVKLCSNEQKSSQLQTDYESRLREQQVELNDLRSVQDNLAAKEDDIERLLLEREDLVNRLSIAEHQLVTQRREAESEGEQKLLTQLQSQGELNQTLRNRLQESQASLRSSQQECSQLSGQNVQSQLEIKHLTDLLQQKEEEVSRLKHDSDLLSQHLTDLTQELEATKQNDKENTSDQQTLSADLAGVQAELADVGEQLEARTGELVEARTACQSERAQNELLRTKEKEQQNVVNELTEKLSLETQLKSSLQEEVVTLRADIDRGQSSRQQLLADEEARHNQELQSLVTEHAQKLNDLQLAHLEALHSQREDLAAQQAGEMAYLKLSHQEQLDNLQASHNQEIERLISDHQSLLLALDNTDGHCLIDEATDSLLLKIAELAPVLAREAQNVNDLCKLTGQPQHVSASESVDGDQTSLDALVERLKEVVQDIRKTQGSGETEDWRRDLLAAVERLLEHQRGLLANTLSASTMAAPEDNNTIQQLLQEQLSQQCALVEQLQSADRQSLLAEIRGLRATLETMWQEQRQQTTELMNQLQSQSGQPPQLLQQLNSSHTTLAQLERDLVTKTEELSQKSLQLNELKLEISKLNENFKAKSDVCEHLERDLQEKNSVLDQANTELGNRNSELTQISDELSTKNNELADKVAEIAHLRKHIESLREEIKGLQQELMYSNEQLEGKLREISNLNQDVNALRSVESQLSQLRAECSSEKTINSQLQEQLLAERDNNRQLSLELEKLSEEVDGLAKEKSQDHTLKTAVDNLKADLKLCESTIKQLRTSLHDKEKQLTKTTDSLLQEKVRCSEATVELRALNETLAARQRELSVLQERLNELNALEAQYASLQREHENLKSKLEVSSQELARLTSLKQKAELRHSQLEDLVKGQLRRSQLLQPTLQGSKTSGVQEMLESLLHQEQLQSLAYDSVKSERDQLEREVRSLKKQVQDWKHLSTKPSGIDPLSQAMRKSNTPDSLPGISDDGPNYELTIDQANSKIARLYAQYRTAETHRKALVFQKKYLVCQVDAFYQTQQAALMLMADMGAPVEVTSFKPKTAKASRTKICFKTVGIVVVATLRFQYVRRRKIAYLQSKLSKHSRTPSVATTFGFSPPLSIVASTRNLQQPLKSSTQAPFTLPDSKVASTMPPARPLRSRKQPKQELGSSPAQHSHRIKPKVSDERKPSVKKVNPLSGHVAAVGSKDPQLMAYIKGLETLQAKLTKTKK